MTNHEYLKRQSAEWLAGRKQRTAKRKNTGTAERKSEVGQ